MSKYDHLITFKPFGKFHRQVIRFFLKRREELFDGRQLSKKSSGNNIQRLAFWVQLLVQSNIVALVISLQNILALQQFLHILCLQELVWTIIGINKRIGEN